MALYYMSKVTKTGRQHRAIGKLTLLQYIYIGQPIIIKIWLTPQHSFLIPDNHSFRSLINWLQKGFGCLDIFLQNDSIIIIMKLLTLQISIGNFVDFLWYPTVRNWWVILCNQIHESSMQFICITISSFLFELINNYLYIIDFAWQNMCSAIGEHNWLLVSSEWACSIEHIHCIITPNWWTMMQPMFKNTCSNTRLEETPLNLRKL